MPVEACVLDRMVWDDNKYSWFRLEDEYAKDGGALFFPIKTWAKSQRGTSWQNISQSHWAWLFSAFRAFGDIAHAAGGMKLVHTSFDRVIE